MLGYHILFVAPLASASNNWGAYLEQDRFVRKAGALPSSMHEEIIETKNRRRDYLLSFPNVKAVGVGPKLVNGRPTGVFAVKVYVTRKVHRDQLPDKDRIPPQVDGIPTDVEEQADLRAY